MLHTPVSGPSVWSGKELARNQDWCMRLSPTDTAEIVDAVRNCEARQLDLFEITRDDFPLPGLQSRLEQTRGELEGGRGFSVLRGLDLSELSAESSKKVIWGLAQHLGTPEPQDRLGNLLHSVTNTGQAVEASSTVRAYQTDDELNFHNDGGDAFMLLCLRTAREGGISKLASVGTIFNTILGQRPDLAEVLQQPFYFDSRAQNVNEAKVQVVPIFTEHMGFLNVLYKRRYIETAQRFPEIPRLTDAQREALDMFDRVCADPEIHLAFSMEPGDIQIGNNYSVLHSRTKYKDHDDVTQRRHLYRVWLTLQDGRPLPEVFSTTREFGPSYARRLSQQAA